MFIPNLCVFSPSNKNIKSAVTFLRIVMSASGITSSCMLVFKKGVSLIKLYPIPASNCNCLTSNEGIYNLVNFSFKNKGEVVYVNNLPNRFETAKPNKINNIHFKGLTKIKSINLELNKLYGEYVCFPYIEYGYIGCDYIEMVTNERYDDLITLYKKIK